jgi:hypothetical protein
VRLVRLGRLVQLALLDRPVRPARKETQVRLDRLVRPALVDQRV